MKNERLLEVVGVFLLGWITCLKPSASHAQKITKQPSWSSWSSARAIATWCLEKGSKKKTTTARAMCFFLGGGLQRWWGWGDVGPSNFGKGFFLISFCWGGEVGVGLKIKFKPSRTGIKCQPDLLLFVVFRFMVSWNMTLKLSPTTPKMPPWWRSRMAAMMVFNSFGSRCRNKATSSLCLSCNNQNP